MRDSKRIGALERALDNWAAAWSAGDIDKLLGLFTDDVSYEDVTFGAVSEGKEALRNFAAAALGAFPGMTFEITSTVIAGAGDAGAFEWVWRGKQAKDFPGLPATKTQFEVRGVSFVEFRGEQIRRCSDYWDLATYKKQVGLST
jgi:steroid delta-isomerase-like uncharacterized protein